MRERARKREKEITAKTRGEMEVPESLDSPPAFMPTTPVSKNSQKSEF
jgi:hypothetical protein